MNETVGGGTDNSPEPVFPVPTPTETTARVAITGKASSRRRLSVALGVATILLTVVGVLAVLQRPPSPGPDALDGAVRPAPTMRSCWDGTQLMSDRECPAFTGEQGLRWLVTTDVPFDVCKAVDRPEAAPGEIEVFDCLWTGEGADVFISRWDSVSSAQRYFRDDGNSRSGGILPGGRGAQVWVNDEAQFPFHAVVYLDQPYSVNVVGLTVPDRDAAVGRLSFRTPTEVAAQGADR